MSDNWQPEPSPWLSPAPRSADDEPPTPATPPPPSPPRAASPISALPSGLGPISPPSLGQAPTGYGPSGQSEQTSRPVQYGYGDSPLPSPAPGPDPTATQMVTVGTVQPRAPRPAGGSLDEAERILGRVVDALAADRASYSIGGAAEGAVCLVPEDGRWSVFLAEDGARRFAGSFDDPEQAAVHFAGALLLAGAERGTLPKAAQGQGSGSGYDSGYDSGRSSDPLTAFLAGPPIEPLAGDPPTSLYTDQRLIVLTPGTEVDRFGDQDGNTVYAARTRYPFRSLPPDFVDRNYRVYRVHDPLRAVVGTAVPWFG